jgi:hypothetical protein
MPSLTITLYLFKEDPALLARGWSVLLVPVLASGTDTAAQG